MARLAHFLSIGNALLVAAASALLTQHSRLHQGATARVAAFNRAYDDAIRSGDNARVLALWTRDGVSLLPGQAALRGREALATFLAGVQAQAAGWKVITQTSTCHDIEVHGSWATEWCETHQVAARPAGQHAGPSNGRSPDQPAMPSTRIVTSASSSPS